MKRSELKQLIREVIEESRQPVARKRKLVKESSDKNETLVDILKGNKELVKKINSMMEDYNLDLFDSVEAVAKRNIKDFGGLNIDEIIDQIKTLKKYDKRNGLVMEESRVTKLNKTKLVKEDVYYDDLEDKEEVAETLMDYFRGLAERDPRGLDMDIDKTLAYEYIYNMNEGEMSDDEIEAEIDDIIKYGIGKYMLELAQGSGFNDEDHFEVFYQFLLQDPMYIYEDIISKEAYK